jgi:hypothetical protein
VPIRFAALCLPALLAFTGCTGEAQSLVDQGGDLDVTAAFDQGPPRAGRNTLVVHVADARGEPVGDAVVTVDPQMPAHGHGSTEDPVVEVGTAGRYVAYPVTFQMAGTWLVTVTATAGESTGTLELEADIP